jgi:nitroreductase
MDVMQTIFDRRSIRKFLDKPVEEEKLLKILDAGRWAPSAGNLQDWQFIVIRDAGKKIQLSEAAFGQYWISSAPIIIILCSKTNRLRRIYGEQGENIYSIFDCGLSAENMLLTAFAEGLGSCVVAAFDKDAVKRILDIPAEVKVLAMIPIGYSAEKPNPPHRMPLESITFLEKYGRTWTKDVEHGVRPVFLRRDQPFVDSEEL